MFERRRDFGVHTCDSYEGFPSHCRGSARDSRREPPLLLFQPRRRFRRAFGSFLLRLAGRHRPRPLRRDLLRALPSEKPPSRRRGESARPLGGLAPSGRSLRVRRDASPHGGSRLHASASGRSRSRSRPIGLGPAADLPHLIPEAGLSPTRATSSSRYRALPPCAFGAPPRLGLAGKTALLSPETAPELPAEPSIRLPPPCQRDPYPTNQLTNSEP